MTEFMKTLLRRKYIMSFDKLFCIVFKSFPDSMQLLVNPKFVRVREFSYPEEGTNTDQSARADGDVV